MDAAGFPWILIETVGVGQTELDIIKQADTTVVTLVPESGDSVQAMKAGLMEVADIFVVNKADRDGAHALMAELRFSVHLHYSSSVSPKDIDWEIPVLAAQATNDVGLAELLAEVKRHRSVLEQTGAREKRRRAPARGPADAPRRRVRGAGDDLGGGGPGAGRHHGRGGRRQAGRVYRRGADPGPSPAPTLTTTRPQAKVGIDHD